MTFKELEKFIKNQRIVLEKRFPMPDKEKAVLAGIAKIAEEFGELSNAVLSYLSLQRTDKESKGKAEIENEVADTLITTLLIAEQFDIDIEKCLENKIEKIKKRAY